MADAGKSGVTLTPVASRHLQVGVITSNLTSREVKRHVLSNNLAGYRYAVVKLKICYHGEHLIVEDSDIRPAFLHPVEYVLLSLGFFFLLCCQQMMARMYS